MLWSYAYLWVNLFLVLSCGLCVSAEGRRTIWPTCWWEPTGMRQGGGISHEALLSSLCPFRLLISESALRLPGLFNSSCWELGLVWSLVLARCTLIMVRITGTPVGDWFSLVIVHHFTLLAPVYGCLKHSQDSNLRSLYDRMLFCRPTLRFHTEDFLREDFFCRVIVAWCQVRREVI